MPSPVQSVLRAAKRKQGDKLRILTLQSRAAYDHNIAKTGHEFISISVPGHKMSERFAFPANFRKLPISNNQVELPLGLDFDLIIAHDRDTQFKLMKELSTQYQLPMIVVEHNIPPKHWTSNTLLPIKYRSGDINVFTTECQPRLWGYTESDKYIVNTLGVDTSVFTSTGATKDAHILWQGDYIQHNQEVCGLGLMRFITGFPMPLVRMRIIGDNEGVSKSPPSIEELIRCYNEATLFLNTAPNDPLPSNVLEAMSCGCPVVSIATGDISKLISNGHNGFVSNDPEELKQGCIELLGNPELAHKMGCEARMTIKKKFGLARFIDSWETIFNTALQE